MSASDVIFEQMEGWNQQLLRDAKVVVVGAGALGNEVLKNLALLNIGNITILDFDIVEYSNLSRAILFRQSDAEQNRYKSEVAAERLQEINPDLMLQSIVGDLALDLPLGLLAEADIVFGCLDNRLARLWLNRMCWHVGRPWVDAGILNLGGQVASYLPGSSCYECGLSRQAMADIQVRQGCTDMARRYANVGHAPTTPIAASIAAALQVQEGIRLIQGRETGALAGRMLNFEGQQLHFGLYEQAPPGRDCQSHYHFEPLEILEGIDGDSTIGETWQALAAKGQTDLQIFQVHTIITQLAGMKTGKTLDVLLPLQAFSDKFAAELNPNDQLAVPPGGFLAHLEPGQGLDEFPNWQFGLGHHAILKTGRGAHRRFFRIGGKSEAWGKGPGMRLERSKFMTLEASAFLR